MPRKRPHSSRQSTNTVASVLLSLFFCGGAVAIEAQDPSNPTPEQEGIQAEQLVPKRELDAVQHRLDEVTQRLVEAYRQLFLRLPEADRPAFLIELIESGRVKPQPNGATRPPLPYQIRELAYDLANAEVVSARPLGGAFVEAATLGLFDPQPTIRTKAAALLAKLDAKPVLERVHTALLAESQTAPTVAMLSIITRHPTAEAWELVLKRLDAETQPIDVLRAALDSALAIHLVQPTDCEDQSSQIRSAIQSLGSDHMTPNAVRMLAQLGDLEAVRGHISSQNGQISRAAAQSLVSDPDSLDIIVQQARAVSALFEVAADAIRHHDLTASGYSRAAGLPAPSTEKREEVLLRLAAALPPGELLKIVSTPMDLTERERLLSTVAIASEPEKFSDSEYWIEERRLLVESLIRTRLQLRNPSGAMRVIDAIPADARTAPMLQDEVAALIWLNRLDDAANRATALGVPRGPEVWLATLEKIEAMDHAPAALAVCSGLFEAEFTQDQRDRFGALSERVASLHETPEDPTDPTASDQTVAERELDPSETTRSQADTETQEREAAVR